MSFLLAFTFSAAPTDCWGAFFLAMKTEGWTGLLSVDVSVIVLFACFAGISLMLSDSRDELRSCGPCGRSCIPRTGHSADLRLELGGGDRAQPLHSVVRKRQLRHARRGALILLALTVPMLWSHLLFQFFARQILEIDASLAASLLGTDRVGNMVGFVDGSGYMVVLPACSSLANMSLAFLCFVSVTQWAKHRWSAIDVLWSTL